MDHSLYSQDIKVEGDSARSRGKAKGARPTTKITVTVTERASPNRTATRSCGGGDQIAQAQNDCVADILAQ